jgi:hypothetical protein
VDSEPLSRCGTTLPVFLSIRQRLFAELVEGTVELAQDVGRISPEANRKLINAEAGIMLAV